MPMEGWETMLDYLKTVFGGNILVTEFDYPNNTPFYIRDGYKVHRLVWDTNQCVILAPVSY